MEKPPSVTKIESEENKEKERKSGAWEAVKGIALGGMIGASVLGGEAVRELMQPQINASKVTDNLKDITPEETVKQYITLQSGDKAYRAEIDSGIKSKDYTGYGYSENQKGILDYADSLISEIDNKDGTKMAVKFKAVPEGMKITYQQIDARGRILSEKISYLTSGKPNVLEEK